MTCLEFERRLQSAVESRDRETMRRLEAHAAGCGTASCRAAWADHALVENALRAWPAVTPSVNLVDRVLGELGSRPAARPASQAPLRRSNRLAVSIAAAALALLAGVLQRGSEEHWLAKQRGFGRDAGVMIAGEGDGRVDNPSYGGERGNGNRLDLRPLGDSYMAIAQDATHLVTDLALLIVPGGLDEAPADPHAPDWFDHIEQRIEPVRTGFTGKLDEWFGSAPST